MIAGILRALRGEASISKKCTCGQQADGKCVVRIDVSQDGVLSQKSNDVVRCGAFQTQLDAASRIVKKQNEKP